MGRRAHNFVDLTGRQFGDWTVLRYVEGRRYECRCRCGRVGEVQRDNLVSGRSRSCNKGSCRTETRPATPDRFWSKVAKGKANECWLWQGAVSTSGYGSLGWHGRAYVAHRVAAWLSGIVDSPSEIRGSAGKLVLHSCDMPLCCNPKHLRAGSQLENMHDKQK